MKKNGQGLLASLSLLLAFFAFGVGLAGAQTQFKPATKNLSELVRAKRGGSPFVLVAPEELKATTLGEQNALLNVGDPCDTAAQIDVGQTIGNALNNTDCQLPDGSWADFYMFQANQGQQIVLTMSSSNIDSYLGLSNLSGTFTVEDDDSGGGTSARIAVTLPETGTYIILANSVFANEFGGYLLTLNPPQPCTFTVSPTTTVPAEGGTFTFTVTTQPQCYWQAFSQIPYAGSNSTGRGTGTATFNVQPNGSGATRFGSIGVSSFPQITAISSFLFSQASVECTYALTPGSANLPGTASSGSFQVVAPAGCAWTAQSNSSFIQVTGSGNGNGTVNYSVSNNNGAARMGTIAVGNQTFTINQAGLNCTYSITPGEINMSRRGGTGVVNISTQPGCTWFAERNTDWVTIQTTSGTGAGSVAYTVAAQTEPRQRSSAIRISYSIDGSSQSTIVWIEQNGAYTNPEYDYTGDGKSDYAIYRPSDGKWYIDIGPPGYVSFQWGLPTDKLVPADYDGNGFANLAVFRPSNGTWYITSFGIGVTMAVQFGTAGDIPVPADYDGDGIADLAVFRPSTGVWYIRKSSDQQFIIRQFGLAEDVPTRGDFDGDGKADIAVWRPSTGVWYRLNSSDDAFFAYQFGLSEDKPMAADYDGDGKTDIAVWRPSDRVWYRVNSSNNSFSAIQFGLSDDLPVAADFDGDRKTDIAVYRPSASVWYWLSSANGSFQVKPFGLAGDIPVLNAFVR